MGAFTNLYQAHPFSANSRELQDRQIPSIVLALWDEIIAKSTRRSKRLMGNPCLVQRHDFKEALLSRPDLEDLVCPSENSGAILRDTVSLAFFPHDITLPP